VSNALARSIRSGPNGEFQFTPIPTDRRGRGELPRKVSLNGAIALVAMMFASAPAHAPPSVSE
jgi:hypothetical protein